MKALCLPKDYQSTLSLKETECAIKHTKDFFERQLAQKLNLKRVSAPLFLAAESGLNDNLNGFESPVSFVAKDMPETKIEIVHSLAKWKRLALKRYDYEKNQGLYTDMNAIRTFEDLDNLHSLYVDQWDWELIIDEKERTEEKLCQIVNQIYAVFKETESHIHEIYPGLKPTLPEKITFIDTQDLENEYPTLSPKEREDAITQKYGAVFLKGIGDRLLSGERHDGRAPDYDDWHLNGDILFWFPLLQKSIELSSMGIRVDAKRLLQQLETAQSLDRLSLDFHRQLLDNALPQTIGGGIGQSRICMFFLQKAHIGEVQSALWPKAMIAECKAQNIHLL